MIQNPWLKSLESIIPYIFRISTPSGNGTAFQILYSKKNSFCGIATAYHVIKHAHEWEENIKITYYRSNKTVVLRVKDRVIFLYPKKDLAFILFLKGDLTIEVNEPKLIDPEKVLKRGIETAWCGFPAVAPPAELCFFAGHISCCLAKQRDTYLVDGVAINGVSGGPAFYIDPRTGDPKIFGVIAAYIPNRETGEILPGLCIVRSVNPYQETLKDLKSLDKARQKAKKQQEKAQKTVLEKQEKKPSEDKIKKSRRKSRAD